MRALLVDEGNDPDWVKIAANGIDTVYIPLRESIPDVKRRLTESIARSLKSGVYAAWNWPDLGFSVTDGTGFADWVDERLRELVAAGFVMTVSRPKVQLNNERHERPVILSMLERWRQLRPKQDTSWTMEGMQGGWMTEEFVKRVLACKVRLAPQCFNGEMTQVWDSLANARDLTRRGFPDALVSPYYDAKHLPQYWAGFALSQGRLP